VCHVRRKEDEGGRRERKKETRVCRSTAYRVFYREVGSDLSDSSDSSDLSER